MGPVLFIDYYQVLKSKRHLSSSFDSFTFEGTSLKEAKVVKEIAEVGFEPTAFRVGDSL